MGVASSRVEQGWGMGWVVLSYGRCTVRRWVHRWKDNRGRGGSKEAITGSELASRGKGTYLHVAGGGVRSTSEEGVREEGGGDDKGVVGEAGAPGGEAEAGWSGSGEASTRLRLLLLSCQLGEPRVIEFGRLRVRDECVCCMYEGPCHDGLRSRRRNSRGTGDLGADGGGQGGLSRAGSTATRLGLR